MKRQPPSIALFTIHCTRANANRRRGSVAGLMAILLPVLAILAAFSINAAQMQLTRTQLMIATDAAARSGGRTMSETQSVDEAITAAQITAALNDVAGSPLQLRTGDSDGEIEFGITSQPDGFEGRYDFTAIPTADVRQQMLTASAIRVLGRRDDGSLSGASPLVIPGIMGMDDVNITVDTVAMQVDRDISIVLDRSGSMAALEITWPDGMSPWYNSSQYAGYEAGVLEYSWYYGYYPAAGETWESYQQWVYQEHYDLGEAPLTLWESLVVAVDAFLNVLDTTVQEEQVSVASYSSNATLDTMLEQDFDLIRSTVDGLSPTGATAIGRGMQQGIQAILDSAARPYASKTMVVMTDGVHNRGINPKTVAQQFMNQYELTIHTVTFGENADQALMAEVADIGGGKAYVAADSTQLVEVFEEIANNLPTIVTK